MAAVQLDTRYLSTTYGVPESTLQSLLDAPTVELVRSFLERLAAFAKEHDVLKAEKLRSDVELEAAVRGGENRARQMRDSVQSNLAQVETLRRQLGDSGSSSPLAPSKSNRCRNRSRRTGNRVAEIAILVHHFKLRAAEAPVSNQHA